MTEVPRLQEIRDELFLLDNDVPLCQACRGLWDEQEARRKALVDEFYVLYGGER